MRSMGICKRLPVSVPPSPGVLKGHSKSGLCFTVAVILTLVVSSCALVDSPVAIHVEHSVVRVNTTLQLNCTLTQLGPAVANATEVTWTQDGEAITRANARVGALGPGASQLTLNSVQFGDSGVYACGLDDGSQPSTVTIKVGLPPSKASDLHCSSHNFRTLQCSWTNGPDTNLPTTHQLQSSTEEHEINGNKFTPCNKTVPTMCDIPGVDEQIWTYYRVKSSNSLASDLSETLRFDLHTIVLKPPSFPAVTANSKSQLLVVWRPPVDHDDYPKRFQSELCYSIQCEFRDSNSSWRECSVLISVDSYGCIELETNLTYPSYIIKGLSQPYGLYRARLRVKWKSADNWSDWSKVASARTKEAAPMPGVSLGLTCIANNETTTAGTRDVQLEWQPLPEYKMNGLALYYFINASGLLLNATGNSSSHLLRGLNPDEYYHISIAGYNSVGATDEVSCEVHPIQAVAVGSTPVVPVIIVATLLFIACIIVVVFVWQRVKKSLVHIPDIRLPNHIQTDHLWRDGGPHRGPICEKESYDELIDSTLFVDLTPESDSCAPFCNEVMANGFVIEKGLSKEPILEPLENRRKHPLLSARRTNSLVNENYSLAPMEQEALLNDDPFLPDTEPDKCEEPSGDYPHHYGGWKDSALSIRSGGSYMHLREEDAASYSNMTEAGLSPISEDGQRVPMDRLGDARETRSELPPQEAANRSDSEQLLRDVPECPYTIMGISNINRDSGSLTRHPGFLKNDGLGTPCIDMKQKQNQVSKDQPCQNLPSSQRDATEKTKPLGDSCPCFVDDELLDADQDDPCNTFGNYVQQGVFLSPSPKHPSSRSGSPRPNSSGRINPRTSEPCSPAQSRLEADTSENPVPDLPRHPQIEAPSLLDSPDSVQEDILPYVLNTCVLSGSAEPLLVNPRQDAASPCESQPRQDSDCSSSMSLSHGDSLSESTPLMLDDSDISGSSLPSDEEGRTDPEAANQGDYITMGQLPPPAPACALNGDSCSDKCANTTNESSAYVTPDQLPSLTRACSATDSNSQDVCCNGSTDPEMGRSISPDHSAKLAESKAANTKGNGLNNNVSLDSNSGYVTEAQTREII